MHNGSIVASPEADGAFCDPTVDALGFKAIDLAKDGLSRSPVREAFAIVRLNFVDLSLNREEEVHVRVSRIGRNDFLAIVMLAVEADLYAPEHFDDLEDLAVARKHAS